MYTMNHHVMGAFDFLCRNFLALFLSLAVSGFLSLQKRTSMILS